MQLSIILVHYKTYNMTAMTLNAILTSRLNFNAEVVLVDNASNDGSMEKLEAQFGGSYVPITFIYNDQNIGFAKANNIGVKHAKGEYVLYLNTDVELSRDSLQICMDFMMNNPEIGALGPKLLLRNGSLDHACKRGFPTPEASFFYFTKLYKLFPKNEKFSRYVMGYLADNKAGEVDALTGAFMFMPKVVVDATGGFDEDFFMYGEDLDLCYRVKQLGYKVMYYPNATAVHHKGSSSSPSKKLIYEFYRAMWLFYKKHYFGKYNLLVTMGVWSGIWGIHLLKQFKAAYDRKR